MERGIFKSAAGLGALGEGIFAGPNALGTDVTIGVPPRRQQHVSASLPNMPKPSGIRVCNCPPGSPYAQSPACCPSLRGLGEFTVPAGCWDKSGFKYEHDRQFAIAQQQCYAELQIGDSMPSDTELNNCTQRKMDALLPGLARTFLCEEGVNYGTPAGTTGGTAGKPCNSAAVIQTVQTLIGTPADGKWGPASAAALAKAGGTFQSYAPGCTGAIPGASADGGGSTSYTPPPTQVQPSVPVTPPPGGGGGGGGGGAGSGGVMGFLKSDFMGIPMYAILAVGGGLIAYFAMKGGQGGYQDDYADFAY